MNRRSILLAAGLLPVGVAGPAAAHPGTTGIITQTLLKAIEGRREALGRFITLNWLAMDRIGIDAGLFTHATLYEVVGDPDCDFVVEVGYIDPDGYDAVADRFAALRSAHATVLVDGRGLSELGRVIGDRSYRPFSRA